MDGLAGLIWIVIQKSGNIIFRKAMFHYVSEQFLSGITRPDNQDSPALWIVTVQHPYCSVRVNSDKIHPDSEAEPADEDER